MEKATNLVKQHGGKLKYLLLIGTAIAALNTIRRADYNFILYLYILYIFQYMTENPAVQAKEKVFSFFLLAYSLIIDLVWCILWKVKWGNMKEDYQTIAQSIAILLSWIGIFVKLVILFIIGVLEWDTIKMALPKKVQEKLNEKSEFNPHVDEPMNY